MKRALLRVALGVALVSGLAVSAVSAAEDSAKALPTLLIKGEVVSVDTNDPAANLLKVKDRYGFETPIFLTQETKITQAGTSVLASKLTAGTAVEVEYNFDVNTAKRHAVSVKLAAPAAAETPAAGTAPAPAALAPTMPPTAAQPATSPATTVPVAAKAPMAQPDASSPATAQ